MLTHSTVPDYYGIPPRKGSLPEDTPQLAAIRWRIPIRVTAKEYSSFLKSENSLPKHSFLTKWSPLMKSVKCS